LKGSGGLRDVKFTYDPRYNIAYIRFREKRSDVDSVRISDELVVDMAPDGTLYGIELLNANDQLRRDKTEKLLIVNEATGEQVEFDAKTRAPCLTKPACGDKRQIGGGKLNVPFKISIFGDFCHGIERT